MAVTALIALIAFSWVEYEMGKGRGSYVQQVDPAGFRVPDEPFVLVNAKVLAPDASRMLEDRMVWISGGKIVAVGTDLDFPQNIRRVDLAGKYVIPGLVDSHTHLSGSDNDLLLYVASGVTGVREMLGTQHHLGLRDEIDRGRIGPRMFVATEKLHSEHGAKALFEEWTRTRLNVSSKSQVDPFVAKVRADGYQAVKMSSFINRDMYVAVTEEARKQGVPVVGHLPESIDLELLLASGQGEVAHVEELVKALDREFGGYDSSTADDFLTFVEKRSGEIAGQLKAHGIAVTSTIWLMESLPQQSLHLPSLLREVELAYVNPALLEGTVLASGWLPGSNNYEASEDSRRDPESRARVGLFWKTYVAAIRIVTGSLVDEGVELMAGTDSNAPGVVPGFSLHDELESLVAAGMTPGGALRSATAVPGAWSGDKNGKILPGYRADLLVLDANPLERIGNTRRINAVVLSGRLIARENLSAMLTAVKKANNRARNVDIVDFLGSGTQQPSR